MRAKACTLSGCLPIEENFSKHEQLVSKGQLVRGKEEETRTSFWKCDNTMLLD